MRYPWYKALVKMIACDEEIENELKRPDRLPSHPRQGREAQRPNLPLCIRYIGSFRGGARSLMLYEGD